MSSRPSESYRSWLIGELVLVLVLGIGTVLFVTSGRLDGYAVANARISFDTAVAVVASIVAILTGTRFLVGGRGMDLLLTGGFLATGVGTFAFAVAPVLSGGELRAVESWAAIGASLFGAALIALAPYVRRKTSRRRRALGAMIVLVALALLAIGLDVRFIGVDLGSTGLDGNRSPAIVGAYALLTVLSLTA